jgi:hypothetical protein
LFFCSFVLGSLVYHSISLRLALSPSQFEPYYREEETFLVKGDCQKGSQFNHHMKILALVEGSRQVGF